MKARSLIVCSFIAALTLVQSACVTPAPAQFGVQPNQLAHIPARIAVLPCRTWPQGALFVSQKKIEVADAEASKLCGEIDKYVLAGFEGQPYMRGISPAVVKKLLDRPATAKAAASSASPEAATATPPPAAPVATQDTAGVKSGRLDQLDQLWFRPSQVCEACRNPTSYYKEVVASRSDWREWLAGVSRATTASDAVLLPFLAEAQGEVINDRGLYYATRSAQIVMLLIDTNNGELIWAGGKKGEIRLPLEGKPADPKAVVLPTWEELEKRIFVQELWAEFPGRQG